MVKTGSTGKRTRESPEHRRKQIIEASLRLISQQGYNGISLQDVAEEVGISKQGLLHYVGSKQGLLSLLITNAYDVYGTPESFFATDLPGSDITAPLLPAYLRYLVRCNEQRPSLVQLFAVLKSESFSPTHPLHDYFLRRENGVWLMYSQYPWAIPPALGAWEEHMESTVRMCTEAMDGMQIRWLRDPKVGLYDEWLKFEDVLFPTPLWDGYR